MKSIFKTLKVQWAIFTIDCILIKDNTVKKYTDIYHYKEHIKSSLSSLFEAKLHRELVIGMKIYYDVHYSTITIYYEDKIVGKCIDNDYHTLLVYIKAVCKKYKHTQKLNRYAYSRIKP